MWLASGKKAIGSGSAAAPAALQEVDKSSLSHRQPPTGHSCRPLLHASPREGFFVLGQEKSGSFGKGVFQKNPRAHNWHFRLPLPPPKTPPAKTRYFMGMRFSCRSEQIPRAHNVGTAIPALEIWPDKLRTLAILSLFKNVHFLETQEILEMLERPENVENKGQCDHILENLEILFLEILEIPPAKRPLCNDAISVPN